MISYQSLLYSTTVLYDILLNLDQFSQVQLLSVQCKQLMNPFESCFTLQVDNLDTLSII